METGPELFEYTACLPVGKISEENCNREILSVPKKCHCGVPGREIVEKFRVYFELNA